MRPISPYLCGLFLAFAITFLIFDPVRAQTFIESHGDWSVFGDSKGTLCYIASAPTKSEGDYKKRGDIYVMVTHRPKGKPKDQVSFEAGYTLKPGSTVHVTIGSHKFRLFSDAGQAWTYEASDDAKLVQAMKGGATMVVDGISSRGTETTDTYSLKGISAAYKAMVQACRK